MPRTYRTDPPAGYTQVPHVLVADPTLDDAALRLLLALKSIAWDRSYCWPSNSALAVRCGWVGSDGTPSVSKVKRHLRRLEQAGRIRREVVQDGARHERKRINILVWPEGVAPSGSVQAHPRVNNDPPPGSNLTPEEDPLEENAKDPTPSARSQSAQPEITLFRCDPPSGAEAVLADDPDGRQARDDLVDRLQQLTQLRNRRGQAALVNLTAGALAETLFDDHSHAHYAKMLWEVVRGERPPEDLVVAFDAAMGLDATRSPRESGPYFFGVLHRLGENRACAEVEADVRAGRAADHAGRPLHPGIGRTPGQDFSPPARETRSAG